MPRHLFGATEQDAFGATERTSRSTYTRYPPTPARPTNPTRSNQRGSQIPSPTETHFLRLGTTAASHSPRSIRYDAG